ncbi:hypothetical protein NE683_02760 [Bariatricus massiliensis]|uniref:Uncharacterized protein n=1 Tax=Bariatricus massiliensis TaxID=1745713 RepID=A0ABS8DJD1_9FIRM|nr:hypothetical protein [Bariatricus massiliensis]MCB7305408.1 hypothetical protein [Bariatricus massiliensis]MCB7375962.1 hypothetical protein [Bariatricus massiliensis]MCB7388551.1 hypothetical protein [Bariatricus massiliensis]MCB7412724.1 hypothetical protein [Bariatricus massiliensis]MCQ5252142.1 hypothetical protein [Bariatricus massiliensis]
MKFTEEIFKRATIRGVADYLLFGLAPDEDNRDYETRLDDTYDEFEKLALQCEKEKQFELLNLENAMTSEAASVYTEIGLQVGIMLMEDMAQNTSNGNRRVVFHHNMKSGERKMSEVKELLKLAADSMKNRTLNELLENDTEYQKRFKEEKEALKAVDELELSEEQRDIVDTLIARKDEAEFDYHVNTYMAGMLDAYEILKQFELTKE